jgi:hypothetical protein
MHGVIDRRSAAFLLSVTAAQLATSPSLAASRPRSKSPTGDWSSPGLATPEDDAAPKFFKTPSGVKVQVLAEGSGAVAKSGDRILLDYVLRRSNGYFIYSNVEGVSFQPKDLPTGAVVLTLASHFLL